MLCYADLARPAWHCQILAADAQRYGRQKMPCGIYASTRTPRVRCQYSSAAPLQSDPAIAPSATPPPRTRCCYCHCCCRLCRRHCHVPLTSARPAPSHLHIMFDRVTNQVPSCSIIICGTSTIIIRHHLQQVTPSIAAAVTRHFSSSVTATAAAAAGVAAASTMCTIC